MSTPLECTGSLVVNEALFKNDSPSSAAARKKVIKKRPRGVSGEQRKIGLHHFFQEGLDERCEDSSSPSSASSSLSGPSRTRTSWVAAKDQRVAHELH